MDNLDYKKEVFIKEYIASKANVTVACQKTGIARQLFYYWRDNDAEFVKKLKEVIDSNLDIAETMILKAIVGYDYTEEVIEYDNKGKVKSKKVYKKYSKPDAKIAIELLELLGKDRGYVKKQELELSGHLKTDNKHEVIFKRFSKEEK